MSMGISRTIENIMKSPLVLRLKEVHHRWTYKKTYEKMALAMSRYERCRDKKPSTQIRQEIRLCKSFWKCYPLHYFRYNLYRKDRHLSKQELINYIPEFFFYNLFLAHYASKKHEILISDKIVSEAIFRSYEIAQPRTIGKIINNRLYAASLEEMNFKQLEKIANDCRSHRLFIKPSDGEGGYGIYIFHRGRRGQYLHDGQMPLDETFLARIDPKRNFIIQCGLEQDAELSRIYPRAVNTFRILTENRGTETVVLCSTLRIGRGGNEVDNSAQNNIVLKVDVETGLIGHLGTTELGETFERHPDTKFLFRGCVFSRWKRIKEFAVESAQKLRPFTYLAWDIALTPSGPVAIEANVNFGLDHYQVALGGIREIFRIDHPDYYWKNAG